MYLEKQTDSIKQFVCNTCEWAVIVPRISVIRSKDKSNRKENGFNIALDDATFVGKYSFYCRGSAIAYISVSKRIFDSYEEKDTLVLW